jgi:hypothetical protein
LGTATLEFVFNSTVRNAMKQKHDPSSFLGNSLLRGLVSWLEWSGKSDKKPPSEQVIFSECRKLSENALAYFVSQAAKVSSEEWAELLRKYISFTNDNNNTLNNVLKHLNTISTSNIVVSIVCALIEAEQNIDLRLNDPFLDSLVTSMKQVFPFCNHLKLLLLYFYCNFYFIYYSYYYCYYLFIIIYFFIFLLFIYLFIIIKRYLLLLLTP